MTTGRAQTGRVVAAPIAVGARCLLLVLVPPSLMVGSSIAMAQEVHGTARASTVDGSLTQPSLETSIVLVDASGRAVIGTITAASGGYALRAPAAGTYRVRARRIGFAPDSSKLMQLRAGESVAYDPPLRAFAVRLATVRVGEAERCRIAPDAGALAHRLWEDAQSALTATAVSSAQRTTGFVLRRFERELDPDGSTVRAARTWDVRSASSEPYTSIAAESLAVHGFVVPAADSLIYYAPDARTLTSDAFARGHCFRPTQRRSSSAEVGLAFAPVRSRAGDSLRDVSGVLWLDRASGELRDLEFTYGLPPSANTSGAQSAPVATGRVDYRRLPNGAWIVSHWLIRMPLVTTRSVMAPRSDAVVGDGAVLTRERVTSVSAVWEVGGDVEGTFVAADSAQSVLASFGRVTGRFVDTVRHEPGVAPSVRGVSAIRVMLVPRASGASAARYVTLSDSTGAFAFDSVTPGEYTVRTTGAALDTLDVSVPGRVIAVSAATSQALLTVIPSRDAVLRHLCPGGLAKGDGVVHGSVRDADGRPVSGARVTVAWFDVSDQRQTHFVANAQTRGTVSGANGDYVVCGVPATHELTATARLNGRTSTAAVLPRSPAVIRLGDIRLVEARREDHR